MPKLTFPGGEVAAQARHALAASSHRPLYDQPDPEAALWLVHDQGVYIMSNGATPDSDDPTGDRPRPAYAAGCDPDRDPDWWDHGRDLVGGDDFAELLADRSHLDDLAALTGNDTIVVEMTDTHLTISAPVTGARK